MQPMDLAALRAVCSEPYGFWLDSALVRGRLGRRSFWGGEPSLVLRGFGRGLGGEGARGGACGAWRSAWRRGGRLSRLRAQAASRTPSRHRRGRTGSAGLLPRLLRQGARGGPASACTTDAASRRALVAGAVVLDVHPRRV